MLSSYVIPKQCEYSTKIQQNITMFESQPFLKVLMIVGAEIKWSLK